MSFPIKARAPSLLPQRLWKKLRAPLRQFNRRNSTRIPLGTALSSATANSLSAPMSATAFIGGGGEGTHGRTARRFLSLLSGSLAHRAAYQDDPGQLALTASTILASIAILTNSTPVRSQSIDLIDRQEKCASRARLAHQELERENQLPSKKMGALSPGSSDYRSHHIPHRGRLKGTGHDRSAVRCCGTAEPRRKWATQPTPKKVTSGATAGVTGQNVHLYCASAGFVTVFCESMPAALANTLKLPPGRIIQFEQTVGYPKA